MYRQKAKAEGRCIGRKALKKFIELHRATLPAGTKSGSVYTRTSPEVRPMSSM